MRRSYSYVLGHEETSRCKDGTPEKIKVCLLIFSPFRGFTLYITKNSSD